MVSLTLNKQAIGYKWVFKTMFKVDNSIERHKACLIGKGYTQLEGVDFLDTFSPIAKLVTIKLLFALVVVHQVHDTI